MDPNATLCLIMESLADGNREEAIEALENLAEWLDKHGDTPDVRQVGHVMISHQYYGTWRIG